MSIQDQINADLKEAMKSRDRGRTETLRGLKSAIKYAEKDRKPEQSRELSEEDVLDVLIQQAKQRRDSIAEFEKANRTDLVEKEAAELAIIETYLPAQLTEDEIRTTVEAIIAQKQVTDIKGMGPVMKEAMAQLKGQADGKVVSQIVRQLLS